MMSPDMEADFLKCYDECADGVYRHCFFRVYSKPLAEELVQEAFMKTWEYLEKNGKEVENLRAFVYRVANNLVIDRSRRKKEEHLEALLEQSPQLEPSGGGKEELERQLSAKEVLEVMERLPEEERSLISLRYLEGMEPREIAEVLGISPNHVSVKLNRAMKSLRSLVEIENRQ